MNNQRGGERTWSRHFCCGNVQGHTIWSVDHSHPPRNGVASGSAMATARDAGPSEWSRESPLSPERLPPPLQALQIKASCYSSDPVTSSNNTCVYQSKNGISILQLGQYVTCPHAFVPGCSFSAPYPRAVFKNRATERVGRVYSFHSSAVTVFRITLDTFNRYLTPLRMPGS